MSASKRGPGGGWILAMGGGRRAQDSMVIAHSCFYAAWLLGQAPYNSKEGF